MTGAQVCGVLSWPYFSTKGRSMERPTVLVLGTRRTDNMPSLTRMLEILREPVSGMHVEAPRATAHVTTTPVMKEDAAR